MLLYDPLDRSDCNNGDLLLLLLLLLNSLGDPYLLLLWRCKYHNYEVGALVALLEDGVDDIVLRG